MVNARRCRADSSAVKTPWLSAIAIAASTRGRAAHGGVPTAMKRDQLTHARGGLARRDYGFARHHVHTRVVPTNSVRPGSRSEAESAHDRIRCLRSFTCWRRLSPICSSRDGGLRPRSSFSSSTQYRLEATAGTFSASGQRSRAADVDDPSVAEPTRYGSGR